MQKGLLAGLKNKALSFREVKRSDIDDLFRWRNHPDIRKNFFNTNPVSWAEHEKWFNDKLQDPQVVIYIAFDGENKIGSIRFEDKGSAVKVSVMLNPDFLGKGFGTEVIRLGTARFIKEKNPDKPIHAEIKKDNIASIKAFQKAGFEESHVIYVLDVKK